jgi:hypothetical protein
MNSFDTSSDRLKLSAIDRQNAMHTLIYRGATYLVPQQRTKLKIIPRWEQVLGKILIYRGATYRIGCPQTPEIAHPKRPCLLIYRGTAYLKYL